ncbi:MAG: phosphatidate cytidylyltransferase [Pirellulales bacterium]
MLRWRLILSVVFISVLVGLCWLDWHASRPGIFLLPLAIVAAALAAGELLAMFRKRGHEPLAWVVYGGVLLTVIAAAAPGLWPEAVALGTVQGVGWIALGLAIGLLIAFVGELQRYDGGSGATVRTALSALSICYVGGLVGFLIQLRLIGGGDGRLGMLALISLIAIVKSSDIGQYTAGRMFGKHKLAPTVSPGKTWEGAAGGVLFAFFAAWLLMAYAAPAMLGGEIAATVSILRLAPFVFALVAAGIVGDLAESLLKRDAGVKDSSTWMPGFGGVLDLIDSLLGAAPVAFLFWAMRWVGP